MFGPCVRVLRVCGTPPPNPRWVFVSRLLVQMGIYTVQEYLLFYVEYAVKDKPAKLSPEAAVRALG